MPTGSVRAAPEPGFFRRERSRGQSIVELAIALPLMLMILLGTVDLGRTFWSYIEMRNAAFEGARYAATAPADTSGIQTRVIDHGVPGGATVNVRCRPDCSSITTNSAATVTVTVSAQFTPIVSGFILHWFGIQPYTMSAQATTRVAT